MRENRMAREIDAKPSKQEEKQVYELIYETMHDYAELLENVVKLTIEEEQDFVMIFFGAVGKGKSNSAMLTNTFIAYVLRKEFGLKDRFNLKYTAWMGEDYLMLFDEPGKAFAYLEDPDLLDEYREKWMGTIFWLDEAMDLVGSEAMTRFNKSMNKIFATCRALQLFYIMNIDVPTKLIPDIRQFRVNMGAYTFTTGNEITYKGKKIFERNLAVYGRKEWQKIAFADNSTVRASLLVPSTFLQKFPPYIVTFIPPYPKTEFYQTYRLLKFQHMGKILKREIKVVREQKWKRMGRPSAPMPF